jgi:hypothetical protein
MVSAWSVENHLTLGQVATEAKSNEVTAIPDLLKLLDLEGAVVTIDAMGCKKDIATFVHDHGVRQGQSRQRRENRRPLSGAASIVYSRGRKPSVVRISTPDLTFSKISPWITTHRLLCL